MESVCRLLLYDGLNGNRLILHVNLSDSLWRQQMRVYICEDRMGAFFAKNGLVEEVSSSISKSAIDTGGHGVICNPDPTGYWGNLKCIGVSRETDVGSDRGAQTILLIMWSLGAHGQTCPANNQQSSPRSDGNNINGKNSSISNRERSRRWNEESKWRENCKNALAPQTECPATQKAAGTAKGEATGTVSKYYKQSRKFQRLLSSEFQERHCELFQRFALAWSILTSAEGWLEYYSKWWREIHEDIPYLELASISIDTPCHPLQTFQWRSSRVNTLNAPKDSRYSP